MSGSLQRLKWACWERLANVLGRAYVAGPELEDALGAGRRLHAAGTRTTIGYWDTAEQTRESVAAACANAVHALSGETFDGYLSLKAPALRFDSSLVAGIARSAREKNLRLHFDSHSPEDADKTFALISELLPITPEIGCTLPGRWRRSLSDADWAIEKRLRVRVVKGQWADTDQPEADLREGYLSVIARLAGRARHVAVATHDAPLAKQALVLLKKTNTPCELELLYGLPEGPARQAAMEAGVAVRVYVPFGHGWLPYCISQVYEKPKILHWILRDLMNAPFRVVQ